MTSDPEERRDARMARILEAAIEVHDAMGCGFPERAYREPLGIELAARSVPFVRAVSLPVLYKRQPLPVLYRIDFICYGQVLVEIKAVRTIRSREHAQLLNRWRSSRLPAALLLNFGGPVLHHQQFGLGSEAECLHA
jgi:GxxExxY protein